MNDIKWENPVTFLSRSKCAYSKHRDMSTRLSEERVGVPLPLPTPTLTTSRWECVYVLRLSLCPGHKEGTLCLAGAQSDGGGGGWKRCGEIKIRVANTKNKIYSSYSFALFYQVMVDRKRVLRAGVSHSNRNLCQIEIRVKLNNPYL